MIKYLKKHYDNVFETDKFVITEGQIDVALVAHLDTVGLAPPHKIFYDSKQHVMFSPDLLGADDRAGVYAIIQLIERGYRPTVIFTTDEEMGCVGTRTMIKVVPTWPLKPLKAIIQLDRRGYNDCVFYQCANKQFEQYIQSFGFKTAQGSFTDISFICPAWGVAGVNLSVGYELEHSNAEYLNTNWLERTIDKVEQILNDIDNRDAFRYIYTRPRINDDCCIICNEKLTPEKNGFLTADNCLICEDCYNKYYNYVLNEYDLYPQDG